MATELQQRIQKIESIIKEAHLVDTEQASMLIEKIYKSAPIRSFVKRIYDRIQNKNIPKFKKLYIQFEREVLIPEFQRAIRKELRLSQSKKMDFYVSGKKITSAKTFRIKADPSTVANKVTARIFGTMNLEKIKTEGAAILKAGYTAAFVDGGNAAYRLAGIQAQFDVLKPEAVAAINKIGGDLITSVTDEIRKAVRSTVKTGIENGLSMPHIARDLTMIQTLSDRWAAAVVNANVKRQAAGMAADKSNAIAQRYRNKLLRARRIMIARTETAIAQAQGSLVGYKSVGVQEVRFFAAHGACPICADMDGTTYKIEEAYGVIPVHPNGRCDWILRHPKGGLKNPLTYKPPGGLKGGIENAIAEIMAKFARSPREHSAALDNAGNIIFRKSGGRRSVKYTAEECAEIRNAAAFVHNHPVSASFSPADIKFATELNIGEMIVTSTKYRFTIAPATGDKWNSLAPSIQRNKWRSLFSKYDTKFFEKFRAAKGDSLPPAQKNKLIEQITDELNEEHSHETVTYIAETFKYNYKRTKVSTGG